MNCFLKKGFLSRLKLKNYRTKILAAILSILVSTSFGAIVIFWNQWWYTPKITRWSTIETGKISASDMHKALNISSKMTLEEKQVTWQFNKTVQTTDFLFNNTRLIEVWLLDLEPVILNLTDPANFKGAGKLERINQTSYIYYPLSYAKQYVPLKTTATKPQTIFTWKHHSLLPYYEGPVRTYEWDGVEFLKAPGNGTVRVAYDHPNNYWEPSFAPPGWHNTWVRAWYLNYAFDGNEKRHIHISYGTIEDWIDSEEWNTWIAVLCLALVVAVLALMPWASAALALGIPSAWCTIMEACAILGTALMTIIQYRGYTKTEWIENVVRAHYGDGWKWTWNFSTEVLIPWIYPNKCLKKLYYYEAWGAERDKPILYAVEYIGLWGGDSGAVLSID